MSRAEKEFVDAVQAVLNKLDKDINDRLASSQIYSPHGNNAHTPLTSLGRLGTSHLKVSKPWTGERVNGSLVTAFSLQRDTISTTEAPDDSLFAPVVLVNLAFALVGEVESGTCKLSNKGSADSLIVPPNKNDPYFFEMGCYLLFLLDVWHLTSGFLVQRERDLYGTILPLFARLFEESLGVSRLSRAINNRFELYFRLLSDGGPNSAERMRFYFTELAKRCDRKPLVYDFRRNFPIVLVGIMDEVGIAVDWASSVVNMIEPMCQLFEYFYHRD